MKEHMKLLGLRVEDKVTGAEGVVTSISFDLYGCIQGLVNPGLDEGGKPGDHLWYDVARLTITDPTPVMEVPDFNEQTTKAVAEGRKGPADKPTSAKP